MMSVVLMIILLNIAIAFALSFWILTTAVKQENWLRILGLILGWVIIGLSVVYIIMSIVELTYLFNERRHMMQNFRSMEMMHKHSQMMNK